MLLGERIIALREDRGIKQNELAAALQIDVSVLNRIEKGKRPLRDAEVLSLADYFKITVDELFGRSNNSIAEFKSSDEGIFHDAESTIHMGAALVPVFSEINEIIWKGIKSQENATLFALRVKSLGKKTQKQDEDIVIIRKQAKVSSGEAALLLKGQENAIIRRLTLCPEGWILTAFNKENVKPEFCSNNDIRDLPVIILGKVIELRNKF